MKNKSLYFLLTIAVLTAVSLQAQTTRKYIVIMRSNVGTTTMWDGKVLRIYGFAPSLSAQPTLPAVTLYAEEGDSVYIEAHAISQGDEHTVHMHGFDSTPKHDGDPLTSHAIGHLQSRLYAYKATHCGTFIYHCHVEDVVHVQMGMYGLMIVKPKGGLNQAWTGGPSYDKEYAWLMSEIDQSWHENIPKMVGDTLKVPPYVPNYFLINGKSEQQITSNDSIRISGVKNETIYLRTANIGYFKNRIVFPAELNATIIDSDGRPLPSALKSDTLDIMPGERFGVLLKCATTYSGNIAVNYLNMNTDSTWNTQKVPVNIGVTDIQENDPNAFVQIYPNPANQQFDVILTNKNDLRSNQYSIINAIGQVVSQAPIVKENAVNSFAVDVSQLPNGVYYLRLSLKDRLINKKVVIAR